MKNNRGNTKFYLLAKFLNSILKNRRTVADCGARVVMVVVVVVVVTFCFTLIVLNKIDFTVCLYQN